MLKVMAQRLSGLWKNVVDLLLAVGELTCRTVCVVVGCSQCLMWFSLTTVFVILPARKQNHHISNPACMRSEFLESGAFGAGLTAQDSPKLAS